MNVGISIDVGLALRGRKNKWLAAEVDITAPSLSRIKKSNRVSSVLMEKLATALDYEVSEFIALGET